MTERYSFQYFPERAPLPGTENVKLQVGNFNDVQIDELSIHNDGVVVSARASTDLVDEFLNDLYQFVEVTFSSVRGENPGEIRHYESSVVVTMSDKTSAKFDFLQKLGRDVGAFRESYGLAPIEFGFDGFALEPDPVSPTAPALRFNIERRIKMPFSSNQWFSSAPLKTEDHLTVLATLEARLAS